MNEKMEKSIRYILRLAWDLGWLHGSKNDEDNVSESQVDKWIQLIKGEEVREE